MGGALYVGTRWQGKQGYHPAPPMAEPTEDLREFLSKTAFFGALEDGSLDRLIRMLTERSFNRGETVFKEGETGRSMYIVRTGQLVAVRAASASAVRLRHFHSGDFFGEMTLIEMQPRTFSVLVESAASLYELTSANLYALYREDVKAYVLVLQNINRELCRRLRSVDARMTELADEAGDEETQ